MVARTHTHIQKFFFKKTNNCKIQWKRFKSLEHTKKSTCKWSECELKKSKTLIRFSCLIDFYRYFQLGAMDSASFHTHKLCTIKFSVGHGDTFAVANHLFCAFFLSFKLLCAFGWFRITFVLRRTHISNVRNAKFSSEPLRNNPETMTKEKIKRELLNGKSSISKWEEKKLYAKEKVSCPKQT